MIRRAARRLAFTGCLLASSGCATTAPRAGLVPDATGPGFAYSSGQGAQTFGAPASEVGPRVAEALADLGMTDVRAIRDGTVVRYEAQTQDGRAASVTLRSKAREGVSASVRVGLFGDRPLSRAVLDRVAVRLGERPPEPVPDEPPSAPSANPFFSRAAVTDSEMLRDQADAVYTDRVIP